MRSNKLVLPADPVDEELARDWTLSEADKAEVRHCRGDNNRRRFALQLCTLRNYGRFLDDSEVVPVRILNHLSCQLELPPVLFVTSPDRDATVSEHEQRIRQYLGYRQFDHAVQERLTHWLEARASEGILARDLLRRAEDELRAWRVVVPGRSTIERLVASTAAGAQQQIFERINGELPSELKQEIDELLQAPEGDNRSRLLRLKEYPPQASAPANPRLVDYLAQLAKRYDAQVLKRFAAAKRYALVACFLVETRKTLLDHVVDMHDQYLIDMCRRAHNAFEEQHRQFRRKAKEGLETVLAAVDILLDSAHARENRLEKFYQQIEEQTLREAVMSCRHFKRLEERGYLDELCARYASLRRYLPTFFGLSFQAEIGSESLLAAIESDELKVLPVDAPCDFVPTAWRGALEREDGSLERNIWEIALGLAVRDALRAGNLHLAESRRHVSFWNLVYDENQWANEREEAYTALVLPNDADRVLDKLRQEYVEAVEQAERGLPDNPFATVTDGRLHLKRPDALEIPERVKQIKRGD